jgi:uncharacterized lipoprotein YddW (UPF0748 family)
LKDFQNTLLEKRICYAMLLCLLAGGCATVPVSTPAVQREFRGVWVATVGNIDWPSRDNVGNTDRQKEELLAILDRAVDLRLNVMVLQIRPACDALYDSKIEPWSQYLTGRMGRPPSPYYDPLAFAVAEAHRRGLELHAWFNPYRALTSARASPADVASNHVTVTHPELVRTYGNLKVLDPAEPGTRDYSLKVVMDVVHRYDIDGVHFDDYFYPYVEQDPATRQNIKFPDDAAWKRYQDQGGKMSPGDWRRENVNHFVEAVYKAVKKEKPWVKFGISPFGIWRPGNKDLGNNGSVPRQITGLDAYDSIYCDSRKWLQEGWVDYLAPQLYWAVGPPAQSFPVLLQWWAGQNTLSRTLVAGMEVSGWSRGVTDPIAEETNQIGLARRQPGASGELLWHSKPLMRGTNGVVDILEHQVYAAPALVPAMPWLSAKAPAKPSLRAGLAGGRLKLNWQPGGGTVWGWVLRKLNGRPKSGAVQEWVLQKEAGGQWTTEILPGDKTSETIEPGPAMPLPDTVALFAVDRFGNLSRGATCRQAQP